MPTLYLNKKNQLKRLWKCKPISFYVCIHVYSSDLFMLFLGLDSVASKNISYYYPTIFLGRNTELHTVLGVHI